MVRLHPHEIERELYLNGVEIAPEEVEDFTKVAEWAIDAAYEEAEGEWKELTERQSKTIDTQSALLNNQSKTIGKLNEDYAKAMEDAIEGNKKLCRVVRKQDYEMFKLSDMSVQVCQFATVSHLEHTDRVDRHYDFMKDLKEGLDVFVPTLKGKKQEAAYASLMKTVQAHKARVEETAKEMEKLDQWGMMIEIEEEPDSNDPVALFNPLDGCESTEGTYQNQTEPSPEVLSEPLGTVQTSEVDIGSNSHKNEGFKDWIGQMERKTSHPEDPKDNPVPKACRETLTKVSTVRYRENLQSMRNSKAEEEDTIRHTNLSKTYDDLMADRIELDEDIFRNSCIVSKYFRERGEEDKANELKAYVKSKGLIDKKGEFIGITEFNQKPLANVFQVLDEPDGTYRTHNYYEMIYHITAPVEEKLSVCEWTIKAFLKAHTKTKGRLSGAFEMMDVIYQAGNPEDKLTAYLDLMGRMTFDRGNGTNGMVVCLPEIYQQTLVRATTGNDFDFVDDGFESVADHDEYVAGRKEKREAYKEIADKKTAEFQKANPSASPKSEKKTEPKQSKPKVSTVADKKVVAALDRNNTLLERMVYLQEQQNKFLFENLVKQQAGILPDEPRKMETGATNEIPFDPKTYIIDGVKLLSAKSRTVAAEYMSGEFEVFQVGHGKDFTHLDLKFKYRLQYCLNEAGQKLLIDAKPMFEDAYEEGVSSGFGLQEQAHIDFITRLLDNTEFLKDPVDFVELVSSNFTRQFARRLPKDSRTEILYAYTELLRNHREEKACPF